MLVKTSVVFELFLVNNIIHFKIHYSLVARAKKIKVSVRQNLCIEITIHIFSETISCCQIVEREYLENTHSTRRRKI